jgi:hypothetical protein
MSSVRCQALEKLARERHFVVPNLMPAAGIYVLTDLGPQTPKHLRALTRGRHRHERIPIPVREKRRHAFESRATAVARLIIRPNEAAGEDYQGAPARSMSKGIFASEASALRKSNQRDVIAANPAGLGLCNQHIEPLESMVEIGLVYRNGLEEPSGIPGVAVSGNHGELQGGQAQPGNELDPEFDGLTTPRDDNGQRLAGGRPRPAPVRRYGQVSVRHRLNIIPTD